VGRYLVSQNWQVIYLVKEISGPNERYCEGRNEMFGGSVGNMLLQTERLGKRLELDLACRGEFSLAE
jgi:hypothetical protein